MPCRAISVTSCFRAEVIVRSTVRAFMSQDSLVEPRKRAKQHPVHRALHQRRRKRRKHLDDTGARVGQHFHHDGGNPALRIRHGIGVGIVRTAERGADVALFNQLPQFGVDQVAVFEPRSHQRAMAAAMSGQPLRNTVPVGDQRGLCQLRPAVGIDLVARPGAVEMRNVAMIVTLTQRGPRPFLHRAVRFEQVRRQLGERSPSTSARYRPSMPSSSQASTRLPSTSRHTEMSMLVLITAMQPGFRLPGLFSGEKDGTKM